MYFQQNYILFPTLILAALGSKLFYGHWFFFIFISLFIVDWKKVLSKEIFLLVFFLLSLYGAYFYEHKEIIHNTNQIVNIFAEIAMISISYLLGTKIQRGLSPKNLSVERQLFYLLYSFFIAYTLVILYSYIMLPQDHPLTTTGMHIIMDPGSQNYDGKVISTHIAYNLSLMVMLIPFLIFFFKSFKDRHFTITEKLFLGMLALTSLILAIQMGRRLAILLLIITSIYMSIIVLVKITRRFNLYQIIFTIISIIILFGIIYYVVTDSAINGTMRNRGFADSRYKFWLLGLQCMMKHPWGGGDLIPLIKSVNPRAHNTWIDIGKSYGILAFVSSIIFFLYHLKYFFFIIVNEKISLFMKNLILIITLGLFANMMVEPIFHTSKSYFFYIIFFMGFLKYYAELFENNSLEEKIK